MRSVPRSVLLRAALWRWREACAGLVLFAFALWLSFASFGVTRALGYALSVAALIVILAGLQRGRFRRGSGGPGVVLVREAQVAYFGPHHGGSVNIGSLTRLELDRSHPGLPQWILTEEGQPPLAIPTSAEGAEGLFDVFAALPGIQTERMLAALQETLPQRTQSERPGFAAAGFERGARELGPREPGPRDVGAKEPWAKELWDREPMAEEPGASVTRASDPGGSELGARAAQQRVTAAALQQSAGQTRVLIWGAPSERPRLALVH